VFDSKIQFKQQPDHEGKGIFPEVISEHLVSLEAWTLPSHSDS